MNADTIALAVSIAVLVFSIAVYVYAVRSGLRMKREYEASHAAHLERMKKYAPVQPRWGSDGVRLPTEQGTRATYTRPGYIHPSYTGGTAPLGKIVGGPWPLACACPTCRERNAVQAGTDERTSDTWAPLP